MRFELVYDAGDWILDNETGEYMGLEEACDLLNQCYSDMGKVARAYKHFTDMLKAGN